MWRPVKTQFIVCKCEGGLFPLICKMEEMVDDWRHWKIVNSPGFVVLTTTFGTNISIQPDPIHKWTPIHIHTHPYLNGHKLYPFISIRTLRGLIHIHPYPHSKRISVDIHGYPYPYPCLNLYCGIMHWCRSVLVPAAVTRRRGGRRRLFDLGPSVLDWARCPCGSRISQW